MTKEENPHQRIRGIYLLPNLFTTAGIFAGFFAIVAGMHNHYDTAAIALFIAMIMDFLDGRVARLTNTQSDFGKEYDSLSDMVSFGLTPALLVYKWALEGLGTLGWLVAFLFVAAVALRLARFNTQVTKVDKKYFQGLSCTASAGVVASMVWFGGFLPKEGIFYQSVVAAVIFILAMLMVSNIRYHSFKDFDPRGRITFMMLLVVVLLFAGIALDPPTVLFIIFGLYALSGPVFTLWNLRQRKIERNAHSRKEDEVADVSTKDRNNT